MKIPVTIRCIVEVVLATFICWSLYFRAWSAAGGCLALAWLVWMAKPWIRQPVSPRSERWMIFVFIAPLAVVTFLTIFFPSFSVSDVLARIVSYPAFAALLWIFWSWQIFREWRREKGKADA
jgi:hypothetical protein